MVKLTAAQISEIAAAVIAAQNAASETVKTAESVKAGKKTSKKDKTVKTSKKTRTIDTVESVSGKLTKTFRGGAAAWIDTLDETYLNCQKGEKLFENFKVGDPLTVTLTTFAATDEAPEKIRVTDVTVNVSPDKKGKKSSKTSETTSLAALAKSAPRGGSDGCAFCDGATHGKYAAAVIAFECAGRQYVKATGASFKPFESDSILAYGNWLGQNKLTVASGPDGKKSTIGGDKIVSKTETSKGKKSASKTEEKPAGKKRGRPPIMVTCIDCEEEIKKSDALTDDDGDFFCADCFENIEEEEDEEEEDEEEEDEEEEDEEEEDEEEEEEEDEEEEDEEEEVVPVKVGKNKRTAIVDNAQKSRATNKKDAPKGKGRR